MPEESTPGWTHTCRNGRERWFPYSHRCLFCNEIAPTSFTQVNLIEREEDNAEDPTL